MSDPPVSFEVSCNPKTIWALPEEMRLPVVVQLVQRYAAAYIKAAEQDNALDAQEAAHATVAVMAGLFADPNDDAHVILGGIANMIIEARSGRSEALLMRSSVPLAGSRKGQGQAMVGAFAISAVRLLVDNGKSKRAARDIVARLLTKKGYTLSSGDYGIAKPLSPSTIRLWEEDSTHYGMQHHIAARNTEIHAANLKNLKTGDIKTLTDYLSKQADEVILLTRAW